MDKVSEICREVFMKIVLIQCCSQKNSIRDKAINVYASPLFKYSLGYAKSLSPDMIYILSAKYGIITPDTIISDYNMTLNKMSLPDRKRWAYTVLQYLGNHTRLKTDEYIILAGQKYREYLVPYMNYYRIPLEGMRIGYQLQYLKHQVLKHD